MDAIEINEAFRIFDRDCDGELDYKDAFSAIRSLCYFAPDEKVTSLVEEMDVNCTSSIRLENFRKVVSSKIGPDIIKNRETELKKALKVLDKDKNGQIKADELQRLLKTLVGRLTESQIEEVIKLLDPSGSGEVEMNSLVRTLLDVN